MVPIPMLPNGAQSGSAYETTIDSIRENLLLVEPNAGEEQIWAALEFSASSEFVRSLPQGLDTIIGIAASDYREVNGSALCWPGPCFANRRSLYWMKQRARWITRTRRSFGGYGTTEREYDDHCHCASFIYYMEKGEVIQQGKY